MCLRLKGGPNMPRQEGVLQLTVLATSNVALLELCNCILTRSLVYCDRPGCHTSSLYWSPIPPPTHTHPTPTTTMHYFDFEYQVKTTVIREDREPRLCLDTSIRGCYFHVLLMRQKFKEGRQAHPLSGRDISLPDRIPSLLYVGGR